MTSRVRVINTLRKKGYQTYVLRMIKKENVVTPVQLKKEMLVQFGSGIIPSDLDLPIGGNSKVTILSSADISDVWAMVAASKDVVLWCDQLLNRTDFSDDENEPCAAKPQKKKRKLSALEAKKKSC